MNMSSNFNKFNINIHNTANKTEDDDEPTACNRSILPSNNIDDDFSNNLSHSLRPSSYTFDDDHDSEMTDGVSDSENNDDISMNNLQSTTSSNFARSFFNNTRRRMSSGIVLSYNFLKGASSKRRDST